MNLGKASGEAIKHIKRWKPMWLNGIETNKRQG